MNENKPIVGTEFKILVRIEPIDGVHMEDMEFVCEFYTRLEAPQAVAKSEMIKVDADSYIALVNTEGMSPGALRNRITVDVPDRDFDDDYRREITDIPTGIKIIK